MKKNQFERSGGDGPRRSPRPQGGPPRKPSSPMAAFPMKNVALWVLIILIALLFMIEMSEKRNTREEISFNTFMEQVDAKNLRSVTFMERKVTGELKAEQSLPVNGHQVTVRNFEVLLPTDSPGLPQLIHEKDKTVVIHARAASSFWPGVLFNWLPILLLVGFWLFVMRQMQSGGSTAMKFGKSKAKLLIENHPKVTFKDVAGCDEAKVELEEIIEFLKEPQKFQRLGGRIPRGALLLGPPGTGKTLLAKAVAGEAAVPFFSMSGSDFVEMFVGVGASVTGDTPVLVRRDGRTELLPIGEFVDGFYSGDQAGCVVPVPDVETLGFAEKDSKFKGSPKTFVKGSAWVSVRGVLRHRVREICEIHYLGGMVRTTPDHSVFIRTRNGIQPVAASDLKPGDVLVNLPMKVRGEYSRELGTPHTVRAHSFPALSEPLRLAVVEPDVAQLANHAFALEQRGVMSQAAIGATIGVSQMTVSNWQRGRHLPQSVSPNLVDCELPAEVEVSLDLLRVLGYYTAEGRENGCLEFTFGSHETDLHADCIEVVERLFGVKAKVRATEDNSTKLTFHSAPLGRFFARHCGTGSHQKHVPAFLWDMPRECFEAYLGGYARGDGYTTTEGKLSMTLVSRRLITELTWLCALHGIKAGVRHMVMPAGRVIKSKPLPETEAWNLIIGKTSNPFASGVAIRDQGKKPIVREVKHLPFDGYVYDLCGCDNEAFFGGDKPLLLHNSRVRDLFDQGKKNAPCITADSVVTLSGGRQVTIGEMFDRRMVGVKVPAMTDDFRIEDATVVGITRKPCTDLFAITTGTSSIRATGNHLFPVLRGAGMEWVRADALGEDDYVAMPRQIATVEKAPFFYELLPASEILLHFADDRRGLRRTRLSEIAPDAIERTHAEVLALSMGPGGFASSRLSAAPLRVNEDLAYVCGLIASDGCFGPEGGRSVQFVNTEPALHDRLRRILMEQFQYDSKRWLNTKHYDLPLPQGAHPRHLRDCYTSVVNNRILCEALRALQARVLELPQPLVAAWLRGVFDGDGCVRVDERSPQAIISAWQPAANQMIRDALLRVGIVVGRSPRAAAGADGNIVITGVENLRLFLREVGSNHPAKEQRLGALAAMLSSREGSSSRLDSLPAGELVRAARSSLGMGQRSFAHGHYVSSYENGKVVPSRSSLQVVVAEMESWCAAKAAPRTEELARLSALVRSNIMWSKIHHIERVEPVDFVYDLCLDRHHCFIANNMVVHNCIIFIDEIDAVGRHRGAGLGGGHDEREQTLNQLLVEMDGFDSSEAVILLAATNRPDVLDPALLRPGRFDRQIVVDWPDVRGREGILKVHARNIPLEPDVKLEVLAKGTPGMSGADLANLVNEAALLAARRNKKKVTMRDFEDAKDKVMLGTERKSLVMTEKEKLATAYHESGHALVTWLLPGSTPVHKVTVIPRGRALGVTSYLPNEERHNESREQLITYITSAMGGRAAEKIVYDSLNTGAAQDIDRATSLARKMVCEWGMSEKLGSLTFGKKEEMVFLGREIATHKDYSDRTAELIDEEVRSIVDGCYQKALDLLKDNQDKLHLLARTLVEREILDGEEMNRLLKGETLGPTAGDGEEPPPAAAEPDAEGAEPRPGTNPLTGKGPKQLDAFA
jgi:ATP-dependent metalloprotease FtsH